MAELVGELRPLVGRPHGQGWDLCHQHRQFIEHHLNQRIRLSKVRRLPRRQGVLVSF